MKKQIFFILILLIHVSAAFCGIENTRNYVQGMEHFEHGDYNDAETYFRRAVRYDEPNPVYFFWLGKSLLAQQKWEDAYNVMEVYAEANLGPNSEEARQIMEIIARDYEKVTQTDFMYALQRLEAPLNSRNSDFAPILSPDGNVLYLTSKRIENGYEKDNIYRTQKVGNVWQTPQVVPLLSTDKNESLGSIGGQGTLAYLFGNYEPESYKGDIYVAQRAGDGTWNQPTPITAVNTQNTEIQPYVFEDQVMFFTSMRPDGQGGTDLYVSEKIGGSWSAPMNLGGVINTPGNEQTPFLDWDGSTLYFASDTHYGLGGFDIFKAERNGPTWQDWSYPVNVGLVINSVRDEYYYYQQPDTDIVLLSSNRVGGYGYDDLYALDYSIVRKAIEGEMEVVAADEFPMRIWGSVTDINGEPVEAEIVFTYATEETIVADTVYSDPAGLYEHECPWSDLYTWVVTAPDYQILEGEIYAGVEDTEIEKNFVMETVMTGIAYEIENIYFDFNKANLKEESYPELFKLAEFLRLNPTWQVEINGHTDIIGTWQYNKELSEKRAQAVVDFLTDPEKGGISPDRLIAQGFSFDQPIATNDTEEGRAMNRRVEMKILTMGGEPVVTTQPGGQVMAEDTDRIGRIMGQMMMQIDPITREATGSGTVAFTAHIDDTGLVIAVSHDVLAGEIDSTTIDRIKDEMLSWKLNIKGPVVYTFKVVVQ